ncbi:MAG: response regulator [Gracilimonas sp.]|uniref:response regulator n=1 Tax=Gracilimonas TaxID=649462 RepID=UPI001B2B2F1A|nr:response regulator [Gracilimonas sp.]MBO6586881.1 response regulator [Gracilimonas sp.]MBO6614631.1 response regulator [Gracilimonas sp.]
MKNISINNVLVIEDEPAIRILQRVLLRRSRFNVGDIFEAANGIEAIDIMSRNSIDLILTDIDMPVMNGIEFLSIIHNHHKFKDIPVVAATSESGEQLLNMLAFWGHGYIRKPLRQSMLEQEISKFYGINNEYYLHG